MKLPTYKSLEEKKKFFHYEKPEQINTSCIFLFCSITGLLPP